MFKLFSVLLLAGWLYGQTRTPLSLTVQPGQKADLVLKVPSPRLGDMIDVLRSDPSARIEIILPSGKTLTAESAEQSGFRLDESPVTELVGIPKGLLLDGPGTHLVAMFIDEPHGGEFRIHVDARSANGSTRVACKLVPVLEIFRPAFHRIPGAIMLDPVAVRPGAPAHKFVLNLVKSAGASWIDVAPSDEDTVVRLVLPDGRVVTRQAAKDAGLEWEPVKWPLEESDDFGFTSILLGDTMLPIEGTHQVITFPQGVTLAGRYVVEVGIPSHGQEAQVGVLFMPVEEHLKEWDRKFGLPTGRAPKEGETRAVANVGRSYLPGEKVELTFRLEGEPVREPLQFRSVATIKATETSEPGEPFNLAVDFVRGSDGVYRGTFPAPETTGILNVTTEISGSQTSGRPFSTKVSFTSNWVRSPAATLTVFSERTTGDSRHPLRLCFDAWLEVTEGGEYIGRVELADGTGRTIPQEGKATLSAGRRTLRVYFSGEEIAEQMATDGPYRARLSLYRMDGEKRLVVGLPRGSQITTLAYPRSVWNRDKVPMISNFRGAGVDLLGTGKYQVYRVKWDITNATGICAWQGQFDVMGTNRKFGYYSISDQAPARPGTFTVEADLDGERIVQLGEQHVWHMYLSGITCGRQQVMDAQDLAYLPEQDLTGLALDKPRPLVRFSEGPYKDKIRPDLLANNRMAIANLFENMLRRLNDEGIRVVLVCVFERGYVDMKSLDRALNLPGTAAFDPARPAGMLLTIDDPEQVPRVIERLHSTLAARP